MAGPTKCCAQICASVVFAVAVASCVLISKATMSCDYFVITMVESQPPWSYSNGNDGNGNGNDGNNTWTLPPVLRGVHEILEATSSQETNTNTNANANANANTDATTTSTTSVRLTESWRRYRDEVFEKNEANQQYGNSNNGNDSNGNNGNSHGNNGNVSSEEEGFCGSGSVGNGTCHDPTLCCSSLGVCGSGFLYCDYNEGEVDDNDNDNDDDGLALFLVGGTTTSNNSSSSSSSNNNTANANANANATLGVSLPPEERMDPFEFVFADWSPPPSSTPTADPTNPLTLSMGLFRFEVGFRVNPVTGESIAPICVGYDFDAAAAAAAAAAHNNNNNNSNNTKETTTTTTTWNVPLVLIVARWSMILALGLVSVATLVVGIDFVLCTLPCRCLVRWGVYLGCLGGLLCVLLSFVVFADSRCELIIPRANGSQSQSQSQSQSPSQSTLGATTCSVGEGGNLALWAVATLFVTLVLACSAPTFSKHRQQPLVGIVRDYLSEDHNGAMGVGTGTGTGNRRCCCCCCVYLASCCGSLWLWLLRLHGRCENCCSSSSSSSSSTNKADANANADANADADANDPVDTAVANGSGGGHPEDGERTNLVAVVPPVTVPIVATGTIRDETEGKSRGSDADNGARATATRTRTKTRTARDTTDGVDDSDPFFLKDVAIGGYSYKQYYDENAGVTLQNQYEAAYRRWLRFEADYRDALETFRRDNVSDWSKTVLRNKGRQGYEYEYQPLQQQQQQQEEPNDREQQQLPNNPTDIDIDIERPSETARDDDAETDPPENDDDDDDGIECHNDDDDHFDTESHIDNTEDGLFADDVALLRQATVLSTLRNNCDFARDVMVRIQNDIRDCALGGSARQRQRQQQSQQQSQQRARAKQGRMVRASQSSGSTASVTSKTRASETIPLHGYGYGYGCDGSGSGSRSGGGGIYDYDYGHRGEQNFYSVRSDYYLDCENGDGDGGDNNSSSGLWSNAFSSSLQYDTPSSSEWFDAETDSYCSTHSQQQQQQQQRQQPDHTILPPLVPWRRRGERRRGGGSGRARTIGATIGQPLRGVRNTVRKQWERRNNIPRRPEQPHPNA